ncbi:MAG TPA: TonB-dependent receptor [Thermoanaerobaculia bacterium]|nr:TonB-dependent receptor [Thermoanaerobaculia bacterium]
MVGLRSAFLSALLLLASVAQLSAETQAPRYAGRSLEDALLVLQSRGLRIVFTSNVVRPEMRVEAEPSATERRRILEELLAPHGLSAQDGPNGIVVVVPRPPQEVLPLAGAADPSLPLDSMPVFEEEIIVTPSQISLLREEPVALVGLSREEILTLPHLGDDLLRTLTLLPGVAGNDVTAQFHVRGGRRDETQIRIDGQELFEPFHLKDLDSPLSLIAPATLSRAELSTGGFSARYGDRMGGVLDMTTITPAEGAHVRIGAGILGAHAGGGGGFDNGRGTWLAQTRRDSSDLLRRLLSENAPDYWDAFGKLDYHLSSRQSLRANFLYSADELLIIEAKTGEAKRFETEEDSAYSWLTHLGLVGSDLVLESAISRARLDRDRRGVETEEDVRFAILDRRDSDILGLRQAGHYQAAPKHLLEWGWEIRDFDTNYRYFGTRELDDPIARIRHDFGKDETAFAGRFQERDTGVYVADRMKLLDPLTLELGLRYDRHPQTRENPLSPRLNLALSLAGRGVLRLAWGRFHQSQRLYELQVEDGETGFYPVERSDHQVLGFEQLVGPASNEVALRVELYRREVANPRRRYENLFEAFNVFPEVEADRVRFAPKRSVAQGLELFLRGRLALLGDGAGWWVNYTYASTEDEIGGRWIPRLFDQTHTVNLDLDLRASQHWRVNLAWRYHTGWPTTPLAVQGIEDEEGEVEFVPVLGRLNSVRLPDYHRLDLRASRRWQVRSVAVDFFVDVQNVYNRRNRSGFDYEIDDEEGRLVVNTEEWPGFLPSAGISFEF